MSKQEEFNSKVRLTENDSIVLGEEVAAETSQFGNSLAQQWQEHLRIAESSLNSDPMAGYEDAPTTEVEDG